ncbi:uncharacterized protein LOC129591118 isoform X2 [Paramacrobiotus metropolitanus]|uniref:uncharacterized protein LOC129591118 isoform X2 n=1 Tax=Paramacrobiotus metropolitanus TaxID=2943436 RepID=UPI002446207F|nr:uncharacterized protein LOC129591118 isoform X2 [Paramacrobiotus metropolitanus]
MPQGIVSKSRRYSLSPYSVWVFLACFPMYLSALEGRFETECTKQERTDEQQIAIAPELYLPGELSYCTAPATPDYDPFETYLEVACEESRLVAAAAANISRISPRRAVVLSLSDGNGTEDTLQASVVEPIRQQIISLSVGSCATPYTTVKIHRLGDLINLLGLQINHCSGLIVRKRDFQRMPRVRQIVLRLSSIQFLEPYTFTTLVHLHSLVLESYVSVDMVHHEERDKMNEEVALPLPPNWKYYELEEVYRLHCDCSFAWLRNFFKTHPYLTTEKDRGEVFIVGSYASDIVDGRAMGYPEFLSVDCQRDLTPTNFLAGSEFSYNTGCYNLTC